MSTVVDQVDRCVQVAIEAMAIIERHEQEISRQRAEINRIRENISAAIAKTAAGLNKSDLHELAHMLYWHTSLPAEVAAKLVGVRSGLALMKVLGGCPSGEFCSMCGEELLFKSRSDRAMSMQFDRRNERLGLKKWEGRCDPCREKFYKLQGATRQQAERVREIQLAAVKRMPYGEYLKTEHWQAVRKSALKRSRYRCQLCNAGGVLDVHHNTYERARRGVRDRCNRVVSRLSQ